MTIEAFILACKAIDISLSDRQIEQFERYFELLSEWNQKINLTTIIEKGEVYEKHFYDSLLLAPYVEKNSSLADIGSGAGFPGIPLKIARPDLEITLIEPTQKRANFLKLVAEELGLDRLHIINDRAELIARGNNLKTGVTTARAVAKLNLLSELCLPLTKQNGRFIAMKAKDVESEIIEAQKAIDVLGGKVEQVVELKLPSSGERHLIIIRKVKPTPTKYPREYSQIKKRPL